LTESAPLSTDPAHEPGQAPVFGEIVPLPGQDESSPIVAVTGGVFGTGSTTVMDREQLDYLNGKTRGTEPVQRDLDAVLARTTRVRSIASATFRGKAMGTEVIIDTDDKRALEELRKALRISRSPGNLEHCACLGGPTQELYSGDELAATIGLQHGHSIRWWGQWKPDAPLEDGRRLSEWLRRYGFEDELLERLFNNSYDSGGMGTLGYQRPGPEPLSRAEQRMRLVEFKRVNGGDPEEVLSECQDIMQTHPEMAFGYAIRAQIWSQQGRNDLCLQDCTEAIRLGIRDAHLLYCRAVAQDYLGRTEEALHDCDAALALDPCHLNALNSRGLIHSRLENPEAALADLNEAIRLQPRWPVPYVNRVNAHILNGEFEAAIADCDHVIEVLGGSENEEGQQLLAAAYWNRAGCHRQQGNLEQALADAEEAIKRNPDLQHNRSGLA